jgi:hypothetical protein
MGLKRNEVNAQSGWLNRDSWVYTGVPDPSSMTSSPPSFLYYSNLTYLNCFLFCEIKAPYVVHICLSERKVLVLISTYPPQAKLPSVSSLQPPACI